MGSIAIVDRGAMQSCVFEEAEAEIGDIIEAAESDSANVEYSDRSVNPSDPVAREAGSRGSATVEGHRAEAVSSSQPVHRHLMGPR
jgi:hypothetical protein